MSRLWRRAAERATYVTKIGSVPFSMKAGYGIVVRKNSGNDIFMGDDYTLPICRDLAPFLLGNISRLVHSDI
jgi:hypothetical protein